MHSGALRRRAVLRAGSRWCCRSPECLHIPAAHTCPWKHWPRVCVYVCVCVLALMSQPWWSCDLYPDWIQTVWTLKRLCKGDSSRMELKNKQKREQKQIFDRNLDSLIPSLTWLLWRLVLDMTGPCDWIQCGCSDTPALWAWNSWLTAAANKVIFLWFWLETLRNKSTDFGSRHALHVCMSRVVTPAPPRRRRPKLPIRWLHLIQIFKFQRIMETFSWDIYLFLLCFRFSFNSVYKTEVLSWSSCCQPVGGSVGVWMGFFWFLVLNPSLIKCSFLFFWLMWGFMSD